MKAAPWILVAALLPSLAVHADVQALPRVDPSQLHGTWYEMARLPHNADAPCTSDATAHYAAQADGSFAVTTSCRTASGRLETDVGRAWPKDGDPRNAARMKVSFLPRWLQWLPVRRSEWWVVMLDPANQYAVVSEPEGRRLRVLARTPALPPEQLGRIADRLAAQGFPARTLVLTKHSAVLREMDWEPGAPFRARPRLIVRQDAAGPAA
ncbi:MAG: lipocalin family protein [Pseudomonadota bacterium]